MNKLKAGIVGCGLITTHKYIPGLKKSGVDIVAVCDLNQNLAENVAQSNNIPKFYSSMGSMLAENSMDILCICTPPATHANLGLEALKADSHLLIEKPMALTVADCDKLINEAEKRGKKICIGHSDLFYPPIAKAIELVNKGLIGHFRGMRILLSTPESYALKNKNHWIHKLPGGILGETGPHAVYLTTAFIKNINEVKVILNKSSDYDWINYDDVRIQLKGYDGICSVTITHSTNQWDARVDIFGSLKNLYIDMHEFSIREHYRSNLNTYLVGWEAFNGSIKSIFNIGKNGFLKIFGKMDYGHQLLINKFIEAISKDLPPPVTPQSGRETVRIMEMIIDRLPYPYA